MTKQQALQPDSEGDIPYLKDGCLYCLEQCAQLLDQVPPQVYSNNSPDRASVGVHMRHVFDRFHCFFQGLGSACINYDDRSRDREIETNIAAAGFALNSLRKRLQQLEPGVMQQPIEVREAVHHQLGAVALPSTVAREMLGLITHSVHHLAIVAIMLQARGIVMDPDFGKAPSTVIYERG
ncbi:MAG: hypothetical protein RL120_16140 [Gammaproteobacteria bacterium]